MINLNASFSGNSASPTTDYPYGSARNVTTTGDNTGTPFVASLQNDIIGNQQYLLQEAGVTPNNTPDNATTSQQFESMWKIFNVRTFTKNMTINADYTLTSRENLKTRIVITDTTPVLTTARNIIVDNIPRRFVAINNTVQTLTFKTSAGTGIAVSAGRGKVLYCDGTNIISDASKIDSIDINSLTDKSTPSDTDNLVIQESGGLLKKLSWANVKATLFDFSSSYGVSGYIKLPTLLGGFIFEWGTAIISGATPTVVTLPLAFPNSIFFAVPTRQSATVVASNLSACSISLTSQSQITIAPESTSTGSKTFYYMVMGR